MSDTMSPDMFFAAVHPEKLSARCQHEISEPPALIKELRAHLDLTQEQFAQKVSVTYGTVNHWENGKQVPLPFLVKRLVEMKEELDSQDAKSPRKKTPR
jgi:putative transcriptional regulator